MRYLFYTLILFLLAVQGCTPEVPPPPVERNDLVVRFFRSLRNHTGDNAIQQGEKLYMMDKRNYFLQKLISVQQANNYILGAQRFLNAGSLEKAISVLETGIRRFPDNMELHKQLGKLRKLRHAERLFAAMRTAPNATAMNAALTAAKAGLEGIESAKLETFFANYQKNIARWNQHSAGGSASPRNVPIRSFDDK